MLSDEQIDMVLRGTTLQLKQTSYYCLDPHPNQDTPYLEDFIAQAQLAHCEPLIRADERERVCAFIGDEIQRELETNYAVQVGEEENEKVVLISIKNWKKFWKVYKETDSGYNSYEIAENRIRTKVAQEIKKKLDRKLKGDLYINSDVTYEYYYHTKIDFDKWWQDFWKQYGVQG